jgi:hypothetical protein
MLFRVLIFVPGGMKFKLFGMEAATYLERL